MIHESQVAANPLACVLWNFAADSFLNVNFTWELSLRLASRSKVKSGLDGKVIANSNNDSKDSHGVTLRFELLLVIDATSFDIDWNSINMISQTVQSKLLRSICLEAIIARTANYVKNYANYSESFGIKFCWSLQMIFGFADPKKMWKFSIKLACHSRKTESHLLHSTTISILGKRRPSVINDVRSLFAFELFVLGEIVSSARCNLSHFTIGGRSVLRRKSE